VRVQQALALVAVLLWAAAATAGFAGVHSWSVSGSANHARSRRSDSRHGSLRPSSGVYRAHRWQIAPDGVIRWDGRPYVRFGFTGNGDPDRLLRAGFTQFTLVPPETWPISGPDPATVRRVDSVSDQWERAGATYYAGLNVLWPWRYGNLIAEPDKAPVFLRSVQVATEYSGRRVAADFSVRLPIPQAERDRAKVASTRVVLFDLEHGARYDLTHRVKSVTPLAGTAEPGTEGQQPGERRGGRALRVRMEPVLFPRSASLRLVVAAEVRLSELPGVNGLPALWKPGIHGFYRRSLKAFSRAYAKPGLRGLMFGDEINAAPQSLLTARVYLDLRRDPLALAAYRNWLSRRFTRVAALNRELGTHYASFDQVPWQVPLHPFDPELARTDREAEREESWDRSRTAWGLAGTVGQLRSLSRLQDEFRFWWCGHWLAEYAKEAKAAIGPVPTFVCSAGMLGDADAYLAVHRWALREGVDGLIRNHYGHGGEAERETLTSLARWMAKVQRESGCTKQLWANEVGYVPPDATDAEASEKGSPESFGSQWAFPSEQSLRDLLVLLTRYGYRGLNRFLMNPSSPRSSLEVEWMARLRPEIVGLVVSGGGAGASRSTGPGGMSRGPGGGGRQREAGGSKPATGLRSSWRRWSPTPPCRKRCA